MYVPRADWSVPEEGDDPPCFRQGDLVRLTWFRPDVVVADGGTTLRIGALEARTETVALLSACCDLVVRTPSKRKTFLISPVKPVPRNIAKNPALFQGLRATAREAVEGKLEVPANLFYFATTDGVTEGVVYLEAIAALDFHHLRAATKLAELTGASRAELQERIKFHFTRGGDKRSAPSASETPPGAAPETA